MSPNTSGTNEHELSCDFYTTYLIPLVVTQELHLILIDVGSVHSELFTVSLLSATQGFQLLPGHLTGHTAI